MKNTNIYLEFIKYLKLEEKKRLIKNPQLKNLEKHHIIPFHSGGFKNGPVVLCTAKNYVLAHYYRYLANKQKRDLITITMRRNQKIGSFQRALLGVLAKKQIKRYFLTQTGKLNKVKKEVKKQVEKMPF